VLLRALNDVRYSCRKATYCFKRQFKLVIRGAPDAEASSESKCEEIEDGRVFICRLVK
jgi:hypothetical protein